MPTVTVPAACTEAFAAAALQLSRDADRLFSARSRLARQRARMHWSGRAATRITERLENDMQQLHHFEDCLRYAVAACRAVVSSPGGGDVRS